jgi:Uma2 family endonuclease
MPRVTRTVTFEEFLALVPDGQKADLLDGVIHMASPDGPEAAEVNVFLTVLLGFFTSRRKLGKIYGPRSAFRLSSTYAPEPDLAFVRTGRLHLWKKSYFQGPPDLAVEIVTEDSLERDTVLKRPAFEKAGVGEYWMVDLVQGRCTFLRLEDGRYREVGLEAGSVFRSDVLPGFWLDCRWLNGKELPDPGECLKRILGE